MRAFKGSSEIIEDIRTLERARSATLSSALNPFAVLAQSKKPIRLPGAFQPKQKTLAKAKRRKGAP